MAERMLAENEHSMQHAHEYVKLMTKVLGQSDGHFEAVALKALENDPKRNHKVHIAENTLRRLRKVGCSGEGYKAKAREVFRLAKEFE